VSEEEEEGNGVFFQPFTTAGLNRQPAVDICFLLSDRSMWNSVSEQTGGETSDHRRHSGQCGVSNH